MAFYYDLARATATNSSTLTETTHHLIQTVANQQVVSLIALYCSARGSSAGGGTLRLKHNTGTVGSGGTAQTPQPRNLIAPAASVAVTNDATAITPGATLTQRVSIGFAQTGGMGGWVAVEESGAFKMQANKSNPVDFEVTSLAVGTSIPIDITIELTEG